jgi:hypothetical protein
MDEHILRTLDDSIRADELRAISMHIAAIERTFSYDRFAESSAYCEEQLHQAGLSDVRRMSLSADGVTTHMDMTMPQAWDVRGAELEIVSSGDQPIPLIDYAAMPLCLANRCAPTPPGGIVAPVITARQLHERASAAGAFVYTEGRHPQALRFEATAKGALGLISDCSPAREVAPGETYWINGWCSPGWYEAREHQPLTCFSIAPLKGAVLADLLARGEVRVRAVARTRLYDGSIYTVTGLVPGEQEREIVLLAHIYEPFPSDDAVGAAALIEIARALTQLSSRRRMGQPRLGIRMLISMERYGFAHYWEQEEARRRALLGVSMDAISLNPDRMGAPIEVRCSALSLPFWGDWLLHDLAKTRLAKRPVAHAWGNLSDDTFISDSTIGVPTQWVWTRVGPYHHSSAWLREEMNDWTLGAEITRLIGVYAATLAWADREDEARLTALAREGLAAELGEARTSWTTALQQGTLTPEDVRRQATYTAEWERQRISSLTNMFPAVDVRPLLEQVAQFEPQVAASLPEPGAAGAQARVLSPVQEAASRIIVSRQTLGMPFSQPRIPMAERMPGNYEQALNWVDGYRDLLEVADRYGWEVGKPVDDAWLARFTDYVRLMARYGYFALEQRSGE